MNTQKLDRRWANTLANKLVNTQKLDRRWANTRCMTSNEDSKAYMLGNRLL